MNKPLALAVLCLHFLGCKTARPILVAPRGAFVEQRPVVFEEVRYFDGSADSLSGPSEVLVAGGRIVAIAPPGGLRDPRAAQAERVSGHGRTLLPGLIDAHVHLGGPDGAPPWTAKRPNPEAQAAALVYSGVTTILAASRDGDLRALSEAIDRGELAGPRIIRSSRIFTNLGGHPVPLFKALLPWPVSSIIVASRVRQVETVEDAARAVDDEVADDDPAFVKIIYDEIPPGAARLSRQILAALIAEVKKKGKRASVHVGSPADALEAVEAGAALLMHVPGNEPLTEAQARTLAASGVPIATTVHIYGVLAAGNAGTLKFSQLEREVMPTGAADDFANRPKDYVVPGFPQSYLDSFPQRDGVIGKNAKLLADAGAMLLAGTDSGLPGVFHGAALHKELQALVALGLTPARVLRMATSDAARVLDPKADYGRIEVGARADLLLVEGDPLADIAATERIVGVWQDGRGIQRQANSRR